jgi:hypothetical protein
MGNSISCKGCISAEAPGAELRPGTRRRLSLPKSVVDMGLEQWNAQQDLSHLTKMMQSACQAKSVEAALEEVETLMSLGHNIWAYAYLRALSNRDKDLYYGMLCSQPSLLLPVAYTPTVGEACQKFGLLPFHERGCYVSITDRGNVEAVLEEYAKEQLKLGADGKYVCDCVVFF